MRRPNPRLMAAATRRGSGSRSSHRTAAGLLPAAGGARHCVRLPAGLGWESAVSTGIADEIPGRMFDECGADSTTANRAAT
jgi:hypothetical protein